MTEGINSNIKKEIPLGFWAAFTERFRMQSIFHEWVYVISAIKFRYYSSKERNKKSFIWILMTVINIRMNVKISIRNRGLPQLKFNSMQIRIFWNDNKYNSLKTFRYQKISSPDTGIIETMITSWRYSFSCYKTSNFKLNI